MAHTAIPTSALTKLVLHWDESRFQVLIKERATGKAKIVGSADARKSIATMRKSKQHFATWQSHSHSCVPGCKHKRDSEECDTHCHALKIVTALKSTQNSATHPSRDNIGDCALEHKRARNIEQLGTDCYMPKIVDVCKHTRHSVVQSIGGSCVSRRALVQNIAARDANHRNPKFATQILAHRIESVNDCMRGQRTRLPSNLAAQMTHQERSAKS